MCICKGRLINMEGLQILGFNEFSPESFDLVSALQAQSGTNIEYTQVETATTKRSRRKGSDIIHEFHCSFCEKS